MSRRNNSAIMESGGDNSLVVHLADQHERTRNELLTAREEIGGLKATVKSKDAALESKDAKIKELEQKSKDIEQKLQDAREKIARQDDQLVRKDTELAILRRQVKKRSGDGTTEHQRSNKRVKKEVVKKEVEPKTTKDVKVERFERIWRELSKEGWKKYRAKDTGHYIYLRPGKILPDSGYSTPESRYSYAP